VRLGPMQDRFLATEATCPRPPAAAQTPPPVATPRSPTWVDLRAVRAFGIRDGTFPLPLTIKRGDRSVYVLKSHLRITIETLISCGASHREVERRTEVDRKTIRRYAILSNSPGVATARAPVPAKVLHPGHRLPTRPHPRRGRPCRPASGIGSGSSRRSSLDAMRRASNRHVASDHATLPPYWFCTFLFMRVLPGPAVRRPAWLACGAAPRT
jgi:hypothetical protein